MAGRGASAGGVTGGGVTGVGAGARRGPAAGRVTGGASCGVLSVARAAWSTGCGGGKVTCVCGVESGAGAGGAGAFLATGLGAAGVTGAAAFVRRSVQEADKSRAKRMRTIEPAFTARSVQIPRIIIRSHTIIIDSYTAMGRRIRKVVPFPGSLVKSIVPSCN